jgi:hypothetical protein
MQLSWPAQGAAEAGASEHELMAVPGLENADTARVHTGKAAQKRLEASGAAKLSLGEIIVPPAKNAKQHNDLESRWCPRPSPWRL